MELKLHDSFGTATHPVACHKIFLMTIILLRPDEACDPNKHQRSIVKWAPIPCAEVCVLQGAFQTDI